MRTVVLLMFVASLNLAVSPAISLAYHIEVKVSSSTSANSMSEVRTYSATDDIYDAWAYIPIPQGANQENIWAQRRDNYMFTPDPITSGSAAFDLGIWTSFGDLGWVDEVGSTLDASVSVTIKLPGIDNDVPAGGAGYWYWPTTRCQSVSGLRETVAFVKGTTVAGAPKGNVGFLENWCAWLQDNISQDTGGSTNFEQNDAQTVYTAKTGTCSGFANLFKAGNVSLSDPIPTGIVLGVTLEGSENFPGTTVTLTKSTTNGPHAWAAVWDDAGLEWIPYDPYHGTIGLVTHSRISFGIFEDESDGNDLIVYSVPFGSTARVEIDDAVTGSTGGGPSYTAVEERQPHPGINAGVHWINSSTLKPDPPGGEVLDVPELPFIDEANPEAFRYGPNPAAYAVELAYALKRDAKVRIEAFTVTGELVDTPLETYQSTGQHFYQWRPDRSLPAGTYFVVFTLSGDVARQRFCRKIAYVK